MVVSSASGGGVTPFCADNEKAKVKINSTANIIKKPLYFTICFFIFLSPYLLILYIACPLQSLTGFKRLNSRLLRRPKPAGFQRLFVSSFSNIRLSVAILQLNSRAGRDIFVFVRCLLRLAH